MGWREVTQMSWREALCELRSAAGIEYEGEGVHDGIAT